MKLAPDSLLELADIARARGADTKLARLLPFGLLILLAFAFIPVTGGDPRPVPLIAAAAVAAGIGAVTLFARWESFDSRIRFIPALACLLIPALLRQAEGGTAGAIGVLPLVPVLWAALYGKPRALMVSVAGVAAMFVVPILLIGPPRYTEADWARAALWSIGALLIGATIQRLVMTVRRQRQELERLALTDSLTELPNHRAWKEGLERELALAAHTGTPVALAMIDLDRLKRINDTSGHEAGSEAIRLSARAWQKVVPAGAMLARFGGDEFGLILREVDLGDALIVAERVRAATPSPITCSIGVASWNSREPARDLFIRADRALYEAKRGGRNRVSAASTAAAADLPDPGASVTALMTY